MDCLGWWKTNSSTYPRWGQMFQDTFASLTVGAGVEQEFSNSKRVAVWTRACLNHKTITELMLYKNMLSHYREALSRFWKNGNHSNSENEEKNKNTVEIHWIKEMWRTIIEGDC